VVRAPFVSPGKGPTGLSATLDPQGRFLFVADNTQPITYVYAVGPDGLLAPVSGSPFQTGVVATVVAVNPQGKFIYEPEAQVAALAVNQMTGALTPVPGSPFDNGPFRNGGAPVGDAGVDPSGHFLLLADTENSAITVFSINSAGALSNVPGSPFQVQAKPIGGGAPASLAITH
jgi:6-phosphogluconolactonase (cycloisomerase 2 family)